MNKGAVFSKDRQYRYALWRIWDETLPKVMFIGLNPSTADEYKNDPTTVRCINYAQDWGYGSIFLNNLFGVISSQPAYIMRSKNPVGPENDFWIDKFAEISNLMIACWGNSGTYLQRSKAIIKRYPGIIFCLGTTISGQPKHPLYLKREVVTIPYLHHSEEPIRSNNSA